jgi:hypothetical protein
MLQRFYRVVAAAGICYVLAVQLVDSLLQRTQPLLPMDVKLEPLAITLDNLVLAKLNIFVEFDAELLPDCRALIQQLSSIEGSIFTEEVSGNLGSQLLLDFLKVVQVVNEFLLRKLRKLLVSSLLQ